MIFSGLAHEQEKGGYFGVQVGWLALCPAAKRLGRIRGVVWCDGGQVDLVVRWHPATLSTEAMKDA